MGGNSWHSFGANINMTALLLQLMKSRNETTLDGIADSVIDTVYQSFKDQDKFLLVGHSFGTLITLKIAALLEKLGKTGHLILIDGSPAYLKRLAQGLVRTAQIDNNHIEDLLVMVMFNHFCSSDVRERFVSKLALCGSWHSKIQLILEFVSTELKATYSKDYLANIIVAILNRLKVVISLNLENDEVGAVMDTKLKSSITLIRPTQASFTDIVEDYGLHKFTEQPIIVHYIEGGHLSILENVDLAHTINRITDSTLSS